MRLKIGGGVDASAMPSAVSEADPFASQRQRLKKEAESLRMKCRVLEQENSNLAAGRTIHDAAGASKVGSRLSKGSLASRVVRKSARRTGDQVRRALGGTRLNNIGTWIRH